MLFAQLVDDPSADPVQFPTEESQAKERKRLLDLCAALSRWESSNDNDLINQARGLIAARSETEDAAILDGFCGGGSIPLEASRLGLEAYAQDLNPVAAFITRALADIPGRFQPHELSDDIRALGTWVESWAHERLRPQYLAPPGHISPDESIVVAWFHVRTMSCPTCGKTTPLASKWWLKRKPSVWIEPKPDGSFKIRHEGIPTAPTVSRNGTQCICCASPISLQHIREAGKNGRLHHKPAACVLQTKSGRIFIEGNQEATAPKQTRIPATGPFAAPLKGKCAVSVPLYGMTTLADLFPDRAWNAMHTFHEGIRAARDHASELAKKRALPSDTRPLHLGGTGESAYAEALVSYMACALSRCADFWSSLATWTPRGGFVAHTFTLQALPMTWDFAEANPFSGRSGSWCSAINYISKVVQRLPGDTARVHVNRQDSRSETLRERLPIVCTDPPYFDYIEYSALSDYFFAWLRPTIGDLHPDLFDSQHVPNEAELVPSPFRFKSKQIARKHFTDGLHDTFSIWLKQHHPKAPAVLFYAFKGDLTGWSTLLEALVKAKWMITRTWPLRIERPARTVARGTEAIASSMVLVCRPQDSQVPTHFEEAISSIQEGLPTLLDELETLGIPPVDLPQAVIGNCFQTLGRPGALKSASGTQVSVDDALQACDQALLTAAERRVDSHTARLGATLLAAFKPNESPLPTDNKTIVRAKKALTLTYLKAKRGSLEARKANQFAMALSANAPPRST